MFECQLAAVGCRRVWCRGKSFSGCQSADKLVQLSDPVKMGGVENISPNPRSRDMK